MRILNTAVLLVVAPAAFAGVLPSVPPSVSGLGLVPGTLPTPHSDVFNAKGTAQPGNFKAQLRAKGQTTLEQNTNPNNTSFWRTERAWTLTYSAASRTVGFKILDTSSYGSSPALSLTQVHNAPASGKLFTGLNMLVTNARTDGSTIEVKDVEFDGGLGFMAVSGMNASLQSNGQHSAYFAFDGPVSDFVLRGRTVMSYPNTSFGDSLRFEVKGVEAVPEPASMAALGLGIAGLVSRRRRRA